MAGLIATPYSEGYSGEREVAGRKGRFNWSVPPQFSKNIGRGRSPMYQFETNDGERYGFRLEKDRQGGRWEETDQSEEYDLMLDDYKKRNAPTREQLHSSEAEFFRKNPHVAGMAAKDNSVILNPHSPLSDSEKQSVIQNERLRVYMRNGGERPEFDITPEQMEAFKNYGGEQDIRETIAGRLISGDPSVPSPTRQQVEFVNNIKTDTIGRMWGESPVAERLREAVSSGLKWEDLPNFLKEHNTWRQISGD